MAFVLHPHPHHIHHPLHGWLTPEIVEGHSAGCACGLDLRQLVGERLGTAGSFGHTCLCNPSCDSASAHPEVDWPHHVEGDGSTGLTGYTRLTLEEIAVREWCQLFRSLYADLVREKQVKEANVRMRLIKEAAAKDPAYAALAVHLGVDLET